MIIACLDRVEVSKVVKRHQFRIVEHGQRKRLKVQQLGVWRVHLRQDQMLERHGSDCFGMHNTRFKLD